MAKATKKRRKRRPNVYPKDWEKRRQHILARDKNRCYWCGIPNYSVYTRKRGSDFVCYYGHRPTKRLADDLRMKMLTQYKVTPSVIVLTVMHLDHDEWNHDVKDERLVCGCQKCHLDYDRKDNQKRKEFGKHYKRYQLKLAI